MDTSDSKEKWNYIAKNLIILDRAVEERYYLKEIYALDI